MLNFVRPIPLMKKPKQKKCETEPEHSGPNNPTLNEFCDLQLDRE